MLKRRDFLKQTAALAAASSLGERAFAALPAARRKLNLLFITVDDMDHTIPGFMGNRLGLTPNLDGLAARSHCFAWNRGAAPICQPSREAMMTGRVPHRSGGLGFDPIHEGTPTLATTLKNHGYFIAAIHKTEHMQPPSCFPWDYAVPGTNRLPSEYADSVRTAMEEARAAGKPFFINCNVNDPHRPFYGSPEAAQMDHNDEDGYRVPRLIGADDVTLPPFLDDLPPVRKEFAQYCNSAQRMDISIGKVLEVLKASPEAENTIVFFSADHGMPFPYSKATVYFNGTRTPALLSYPGMSKPRRITERTCNIDYMPTLLDLMGQPKPEGMDGTSWLPIVNGQGGGDRKLLTTYVNGISSGAQHPSRAVQDERFALLFMPWSDGKLMLHTESMQGLTFPAMREAAKTNPAIAERVNKYVYGKVWSFYDTQADPGERVDLYKNPEQQARITQMKAHMREVMVRTGDPQLQNFDRVSRGEAAIVPQPEHLRVNAG